MEMRLLDPGRSRPAGSAASVVIPGPVTAVSGLVQSWQSVVTAEMIQGRLRTEVALRNHMLAVASQSRVVFWLGFCSHNLELFLCLF